MQDAPLKFESSGLSGATKGRGKVGEAHSVPKLDNYWTLTHFWHDCAQDWTCKLLPVPDLQGEIYSRSQKSAGHSEEGPP
jgi:hypothetical protein